MTLSSEETARGVRRLIEVMRDELGLDAVDAIKLTQNLAVTVAGALDEAEGWDMLLVVGEHVTPEQKAAKWFSAGADFPSSEVHPSIAELRIEVREWVKKTR
jgi:hypothetical protein